MGLLYFRGLGLLSFLSYIFFYVVLRFYGFIGLGFFLFGEGMFRLFIWVKVICSLSFVRRFFI